MLSKLLKSTVIAALVGLAGVAAVTPASARGNDNYHGGYHRDSGWGRDYDRHDRYNRHDRHDRGWGWRHNRHNHHGWY